MHPLYRRRAILVVAMLALQPASEKIARASDPERDSLWDILLRAPEPKPDIPTPNPFNIYGSRQPLGPVPGFTLPAPEKTASNSGKGSKKRRKPSMFGSVGDWFTNLEKATGSKIQATGSSTFQLRSDSITGSSDTYQNEQYYGRGSNGFYNDTDISVDATLFKYLHYQTRLSNALLHNSNDNRFKIDYKDKRTHVEYGDINAGFAGNTLVDFNRYLSGVKASNVWSKNFKTSLIWSQIKAQSKTIVINGSNSSGPYYVYSGQIVEGSDHVRIDNSADLIKGKDYQLDPYSGALKFLEGRIVPQSSTIAISYETLGFDQSQGTILGGRAEYRLNSNLNLGMTYVTQTTKGSSGSVLRSEESFGFGQQTFYSTEYPIDLTKPFFIYIDGRLLGADEYTIDRTNTYTNRVFIKLAVLGTSKVKFSYYPYNNVQTPGDRSILGFDSRLSLGKFGSVTLDTAFSGLSLSGNHVNGQGWSLRADLTPVAKVHSTFSLKNVGPSFSSIQSPGFNRNEKAIQLTTEYAPTQRLRFNADYQISKRPSYNSSQFAVTSQGNDDYRQFSLGSNYTIAKNATLSLNHSTQGTAVVQGGKSFNNSDTLALNYALKSVNFEVSLSNNKSNADTTFSTLGLVTSAGSNNAQLYHSDTSTFSKRFAIGWTPSSWLHLNGSIADNSNKNNAATTNQSSNSKEAAFSAQLSLIRNLHVNYAYSLSDTGSVNNSSLNALTSGGTNNGLGSSGSYSGGQGTSYGSYANFGGKNTSHSLHLDYQPKQNMLLGFQIDKGSSTGDFQYNSDRNTVGFNFSWQPSSEMQLSAAVTQQKVLYTNGFGGTDSNNILLSLDGHPFGHRNGFLGKIGMRINYSLVKTNSAFKSDTSSTILPIPGTGTSASLGSSSTSILTDTSTNLTSLGFRVDYPLSSRQSIFVETLRSQTSGYQGNAENNLKFGLDFAVTRTVKFSFGWQILQHTYLDAANAHANYKASSLLAELGFHF